MIIGGFCGADGLAAFPVIAGPRGGAAAPAGTAPLPPLAAGLAGALAICPPSPAGGGRLRRSLPSPC
jgi:hypothetical protein